jgi:hypothetical protein
MIPAVMKNGTILGIKEQIKIGKDLNKKIIQIAISKNAQKMDSPKPFTRKLLPSKKVTLLPVITTLYLAVSKIAIEALSIFCNNIGGLNNGTDGFYTSTCNKSCDEKQYYKNKWKGN